MRLSKWLSGFCAAAVLTVALAAPASAAIRGWYVCDSLVKSMSSDSAGVCPGLGRSINGLGTFVAPYRCIRQVNTQVQPGDTVYVYSLSIADTADLSRNLICPATSGTSSAHIVYLGKGDNGLYVQTSYGSKLPVPGILDSVSYITVKGFRVKDASIIRHCARYFSAGYYYTRSDVATTQPTADSIAYCRMQRMNFCGAKSCVVYKNYIDNSTATVGGINPTVAWYANDGQIGENYCGSGNADYDKSPGNCASCNYGNSFISNVVKMGTIQVASGATNLGFVMRSRSQHNTIQDNVFTATFAGTNGGCIGRLLAYAPSNLFYRNKWTFEASAAVAAGGSWKSFTLRDSSSNNTFRRDTVFAGTTSYYLAKGWLLDSGTFSDGLTAMNYDSCYFRMTDKVTVGAPFHSGSVTYSVFDANGTPALDFGTQTMDNLTLSNNTFFTRRLGPALGLGTLPTNHRLMLTQNIFYADSVTAAAEADPVHIDGCYLGTSYPVLRVPTSHSSYGGLTSEHNLYFSRIGTNTAPTSDNLAVGDANFASAVGVGSCWATSFYHDIASLYGNPAFADTTWAAFSPRFVVGTLADSSAFIDYAGAIAPTGPTTSPDTTYALDGSLTPIYFGGVLYTLVSAIIQPPASGASQVRIVLTASGGKAAGDKPTLLGQSAFDARWAAGADSATVFVKPDLTTDPAFPLMTPSLQFLGYMPGGPGTRVLLQVQVVDIWENKSGFSAMYLTGNP